MKEPTGRIIPEVKKELTPEEHLIRLCHVACIWAEVKFCGVRDGLCYFEWWSDSDDSDDSGDTDRLPALLSVPVPAEGLTRRDAVDQMVRQIGAEVESNQP
jgi:hypothetical protein